MFEFLGKTVAKLFGSKSERDLKDIVPYVALINAEYAKLAGLTDDQLRAIRDSGGLVGVSLSVSELRPDGHNQAATPLAVVLRHMDHLLAILGPDGVAIGSDFDGAVLPEEVGNAAGLQRLVAAMAGHGYDDELLHRICHGNWLGMLERSLA